MENLLELKKCEEFESNAASNEIQITEELKNVFIDVFKCYNCEDKDTNYDMENENFSEILKTGKYFNIRYQLNKEKYNEFLKKYTPTNAYYYAGDNKKESEIIKIQDNLIYVSSDLYIEKYNDEEFKGFNAFVHLCWVDPKEYNEELDANIPQEYAEDWFAVELKSLDDCDKLVKLLLDVVECLGMPDIEYRDKLIDQFIKEQESINKTINNLKSIK